MKHEVEIPARVRRVVGEQLGYPVEQITDSSHLISDLNGDSLDMVELIMGLEDEFDIEIDDDKVDQIFTVQDAINCVLYCVHKLGRCPTCGKM